MQDGKQRRTQAERRAETKRALLDAARNLFVEKGFAETGVVVGDPVAIRIEEV